MKYTLFLCENKCNNHLSYLIYSSLPRVNKLVAEIIGLDSILRERKNINQGFALPLVAACNANQHQRLCLYRFPKRFFWFFFWGDCQKKNSPHRSLFLKKCYQSISLSLSPSVPCMPFHHKKPHQNKLAPCQHILKDNHSVW